MAFNPGQLEVLKLLLNMSAEQRERALQSVLEKDGAPRSPLVRRRQSAGGYRTPTSDDSSVSAVSEDGDGRKRVHSKNRITRLATKICQEYLNCERMWSHLYGSNNRVVEHKFDNVLDQIKVNLEYAEQKTLKTHREQLKKCLKKRMASGRRYRSQQKLVGKFVQESHKAKTIDLTADDADFEDNDSADKGSEDNKKKGSHKDDDSETPTESSLSEVKQESKAKAAAAPKKGPRTTRKQRAEAFAKRMAQRRSAKKGRKQSSKKKQSGELPSGGEEVSAEAEASGDAETVAKTKSNKRTSKRKQSAPATTPKKKSRRTSQRNKKKSSPTKSPVSFPLGTRVARDFNGVVFTGEITKLYPDAPHLCEITYSDGDTEDLEAGQVSYASQLYARDFSGK